MTDHWHFPGSRVAPSLVHGRPQGQALSSFNLEMDPRNVGHHVWAITAAGKLLSSASGKSMLT